MKVPLYENRRRVVSEVAASPLNAQISVSALTMPGRAEAQAGQQTAKAGAALFKFGQQMLDSSSETLAKEAATEYQTDLLTLKEQNLTGPIQPNQEREFSRKQKLLQEKHSAKIPFGLARDKFKKEIRPLNARSILDFNKRYRARVVDSAKANVEKNITDTIDVAGNPKTSIRDAENAIVSLNNRLAEAATRGLLKLKDIQEKRLDAYKRITQTRLSELARTSPNGDDVITAFERGVLEDPIIKGLKISTEDRQKVAQSVFSNYVKAIRFKKFQSEQERKNIDRQYDKDRNQIVNTNFDDPEQVAKAEKLFEKLKAANYFDTREKLQNFENLFKTDVFADQTDTAVFRVLSIRAQTGLLTPSALLASSGLLTKSDYTSLLQQTSQPREATTKQRRDGEDANKILQRLFRYSEEVDPIMEQQNNPARAGYFEAQISLIKYIKDNEQSSDFDPVSEAERLHKEYKEKNAPTIKLYYQSRISGALKSLNYVGLGIDSMKDTPDEMMAKVTSKTGNFADPKTAITLISLINEYKKAIAN